MTINGLRRCGSPWAAAPQSDRGATVELDNVCCVGTHRDDPSRTSPSSQIQDRPMPHFDPQILKYIPIADIPKHLKNLHAGVTITHGTHESLVPGYLNDLEWNFYDELHRYYVHDTYHGLYKVMTGKYFSVNVVKWGNLPVFIQVANAKIADGLFYQSMTVLGIIMLHQVQRITQKDDNVLIQVDWYTASHWLFRWLHGPFNRRLLKLQKKQDREDNEEIRGRRRDLRHRGFKFATDDPDFINANRLTNHVLTPEFDQPTRFPLAELAPGRIERLVRGPIELLAKPFENGDVHVWPALCPHEGADLHERHMCEGVIECPWHGRKFPGALLRSNSADSYRYLDMTVRVADGAIEVVRQPGVRAGIEAEQATS
jgi:nitrite reductase/ring-hydroxylating ferredoxin subunit